ncbi:PGN_0703 family putative restriction endonuclease [Anaeromyxobacter oryzisoli]|uniref:PGN_0703 family putative restriction endonuclease n=1 Tax=Anaeromyxobacter oryzisoli TaxID=2925408 RepID=UPI001F5AD944|nr:hypothetical protein [Anaeromyxobacter sp. SG63]
MRFRERERERQAALRAELYTGAAACDGQYPPSKRPTSRRNFCIHEDHSAENLWRGIRDEAIAYFRARGIEWHAGLPPGKRSRHEPARSLPSNHLCCSQCSCVNALFPLRHHPGALTKVLAAVLEPQGLRITEVLRFELDDLPGSPAGYVAFEWIGRKNYLRETSYGRVAADDERDRGKGFTSADFAVRVRLASGATGLLLGEWKYTERYASKSIRYSDSGTDRLEIYRPALEAPWSQVARLGNADYEDLFFDPFDQIMRLQLLAGEIEHAGAMGDPEMGATFACVLHVAPVANVDLMKRVTSARLAGRGDDVHQVWRSIASDDRFFGIESGALLHALAAHAPDADWGKYLVRRYVTS